MRWSVDESFERERTTRECVESVDEKVTDNISRTCCMGSADGKLDQAVS